MISLPLMMLISMYQTLMKPSSGHRLCLTHNSIALTEYLSTKVAMTILFEAIRDPASSQCLTSREMLVIKERTK